VEAGYTTRKSQEVLSYIYHVYEGQGFSTMKTPNDQTAKRIDWVGKDTFTVPAWSELSHTCTMEAGAAYLFAINDKPMVENLTFFRKL
jgi:gentisate 1,2-dioxygenase